MYLIIMTHDGDPIAAGFDHETVGRAACKEWVGRCSENGGGVRPKGIKKKDVKQLIADWENVNLRHPDTVNELLKNFLREMNIQEYGLGSKNVVCANND